MPGKSQGRQQPRLNRPWACPRRWRGHSDSPPTTTLTPHPHPTPDRYWHGVWAFNNNLTFFSELCINECMTGLLVLFVVNDLRAPQPLKEHDRNLSRATAATRGWKGYQNKSQHRMLTTEKNIFPPLLRGLKPGTFRSRVRRSDHWARWRELSSHPQYEQAVFVLIDAEEISLSPSLSPLFNCSTEWMCADTRADGDPIN